MTVDESLQRVLAYTGLELDQIDAESSRRLALGLGLDEGTLLDFVAYMESLARDTSGAKPSEFDLRIGNWRLDLAKESIRGLVMSSVLSAVFVAHDMKLAGVAVLSAVLPSLLEIESVSLSPGDERLLIEVRRTQDVADESVRADALYERLSDEARDGLNRYDFADFVDRLRGAGLATTNAEDGTVLLLDSGAKRPLISIR